MARGRPGLVPGVCGNPKGRPRGSKNKYNVAAVKEAFLAAFFSPELGGKEGLIKWATQNQTNRSEFYRITTKLIPASLTMEGDMNVKFKWIQEPGKDANDNGPL